MKRSRTIPSLGLSFVTLINTLGCGSTAQKSAQLTNTASESRTLLKNFANQDPGEKTPVLIDTDMAVDDWIAILFLLSRTDIDVKAITITGAGETHCKQGVMNALSFLALKKKVGVAVACGRNHSYEGGHLFPSEWREDADTVLSLTLPTPLEQPSPLNAAEIIEDLAARYANKITVVTLGPLTNLADALNAKPSIKSKIKMVYTMGGAVNVPGNVYASTQTIDNNVAEWNIYADPRAAQQVVSSGIPLTLIPLDATNHVPLDMAFVEDLGLDHTAPAADFVYQVVQKKDEFVKSEGWFFWDPLAAMIAVDESQATIMDQNITIVLAPETLSGQTLEAKGGTPVRVATDADGAKFKSMLLQALRQMD